MTAGLAILLILLITNSMTIKAQYTMPEVMDTGTFRQQLDFVEERTRIYNDFRAIREDIFQKIFILFGILALLFLGIFPNWFYSWVTSLAGGLWVINP